MVFGWRQPRERASETGTSRRLRRLLAGDGDPARDGRLGREDVAALARDRSPTTRSRIARKFGRQYDELARGGSAELARAVLELLVADVAREVRAALAESIADSPALPPAVARRLARDAIEVARPVLERSPVLDEAELMDIVRTHSWPYALAVAGRSGISEELAHALLDVGEERVAARLAGNLRSALTRRVLERLAEEYRDAPTVRERLVRRPALPFEVLERLAEAVGEALSWDLVRSRRMTPEEARRLVTALKHRVAVGLTARDRDQERVLRHMRRRWRAGELSPDEFLAFLRDGDVLALEAAFAAASDLPPERVRAILTATDRRPFAALCARAGLPTGHYLALRMALELAEACFREGREMVYGSDTARYVCEQYEALRADPARIEALLDGGGPAAEGEREAAAGRLRP